MRPAILLLLFLCLPVSPSHATPIRDGLWNGKGWKLEELRNRVRKGEPAAHAEMAYYRIYGPTGAYDPKEIHRSSMLAAKAGDPLGMAMAFRCHLRAIGTSSDLAEAFTWAGKSAAAGHPLGIKELSFCYHVGIGCDVDFKKAGQLLEQAAERDCLMAIHNIAAGYVYGYIYKEDPQRGLEVLESWIGKPDTETLAALYLKFHDNPATKRFMKKTAITKALTTVRNAAAAGNPESMCALGIYHISNGDVDRGLPLLIRSANLGCYASLEELWNMNNSKGWRPHDPVAHSDMFSQGEIALELLRRGATAPRIVGFSGWYLSTPERPGGPDHPRAIPLLRDAWKRGNVHALKQLGEVFLGPGKQHDPRRGIALMELAASLDASHATPFVVALAKTDKPYLEIPRFHALTAYALKKAPQGWEESVEFYKRASWEMCDENQKKAALELIEKGYPSAREFQIETVTLLIELQELPENTVHLPE